MTGPTDVRQILLIIVRSSAKKTDRTSVRAEDTLHVAYESPGKDTESIRPLLARKRGGVSE